MKNTARWKYQKMNDETHVLGNQEEQKRIKKLLEQAGRDKVIDSVVRGKEETPESAVKPDLSITSEGDVWRIFGVEYRGGVHTVDLVKSLLDGPTTQDEWARYSDRRMEIGTYHVGDMPLYHSLFTALYRQRDKPEAEEAREFIEKQMFDNWLMTLTRIRYYPKGKDKIIHNYGTRRRYEIRQDITGKNKELENETFGVLNAILGTNFQNAKEIKEVYNWICGRDVEFRKVMNSMSLGIDDRVVGFSNNAPVRPCYIDCQRLVDSTNEPALLVRIVGWGK